MNAIEIYIDESGDFGPFDERCPYYIVTMVFHETTEPLFALIETTGTLAKSELKFFGTIANFQRNWLDPFAKREWR